MADAEAARSRLVEIVKRRSFSTGSETRLVSGRSTSFYFNMKPTMLDPEGAQLIAVVLDCDQDENVRRLTSPGRSELHKLTRPDFLKHLRASYRLLRPQGVDLIDIDVSTLSAGEAASRIEKALPASPRP